MSKKSDFLDAADRERERDNRGFLKAVDLTEKEVRGATSNQKSMHGQKKSLATRMPEEIYAGLLADVKRWAEHLQMTQNDVQLWAMLRGLDALEDGERPEVDEAEVVRPLKL